MAIQVFGIAAWSMPRLVLDRKMFAAFGVKAAGVGAAGREGRRLLPGADRLATFDELRSP